MLNYNTPYEIWYRRYYDSESSDSEAGKGHKDNGSDDGSDDSETPPPPPPPPPPPHPRTNPKQFIPTLKQIPTACIVMQRDTEFGPTRDSIEWFKNSTDGDKFKKFWKNQVVQYCKGDDGELCHTSCIHPWSDTGRMNWSTGPPGVSFMFPYWTPDVTCWTDGTATGVKIVIKFKTKETWTPRRNHDAVKVCYRMQSVSDGTIYPPEGSDPYFSNQITLSAGSTQDLILDMPSTQIVNYATIDKGDGRFARIGIVLWLEYASTSDLNVTGIDVWDGCLKSDSDDSPITLGEKAVGANTTVRFITNTYSNTFWYFSELWTCMPGDYINFEVVRSHALTTSERTFKEIGLNPYNILGEKQVTPAQYAQSGSTLFYSFPTWSSASLPGWRDDFYLWNHNNVPDSNPLKSHFWGGLYKEAFEENLKFDCGLFLNPASESLEPYGGAKKYIPVLCTANEGTVPNDQVKTFTELTSLTTDEIRNYQFSPPWCEGMSWYNESSRSTMKDYNHYMYNDDECFIWIPTATKFIIRLVKGPDKKPTVLGNNLTNF